MADLKLNSYTALTEDGSGTITAPELDVTTGTIASGVNINGTIKSGATLGQVNTPINGGTLTSSTTPRFAIGDGWLSGGSYPAPLGTDYYGYQEVSSGSGIVIGTVHYHSGAADSYLCGMVEVMYTAVGDANRSGYYKFRIGYTGNTSTTQLEGSAQNSSLTCTKPNDGTTQSITLTPTTTGGQTVKVWYRFFGFPAKAV